MSERDDDFEDLVGPDAQADEAGDVGKTPADQDEGKGDKEPPADDAGKTPADQDEDADKTGDDASKDDADADKDGADADADKGADKEQKFVPKQALDSVKRKNRDLTARLKRIEERLGAEDAEIAKAAIPDPKTHPVEHAQYVQRQTQAVILNDRMNLSEYHARKAHGDDTVTEAFEWANAQMEDPKTGQEFAKTLFGHIDPYDHAVTLYKAAKEAGDGGAAGDPEYEAFKAWKASQGADGKPAGKPAEQQQQAEKPERPQSLAQQSSAAGPKGDKLVEDPFSSEFGG